MPVVVKVDGKYLVRAANPRGRRARTLTSDLSEATTWSRPHHAVAAVNACVSGSRSPITPGQALEIVQVELREVAVVLRVRGRRKR